jgi:TonB family protein
VNENGTVTSVGVMKSTGSQILDLAAAGGLYQWRAKPGRRREIDMPMTFRLWHSYR